MNSTVISDRITAIGLARAHLEGKVSPAETVAACYAAIRSRNDPAIFIHLRLESEAVEEATSLASRTGKLPLLGVPVAVKDNIDVAGMPTTAACPAFSYVADRDASAVANLRAAGAIVIGKTNLDQFATGLVGVRSPYGIPRNAFKPDLIPGGSSSGSAVAVSAGLVPLALGTDTAGSGRVPAMLNNVVGLKPSVGLVSTSGVVPACRTLDCVSIFSLTVDDAALALKIVAGPDAADPYSRTRPVGELGDFPQGLRLGVPRAGQLKFFGDRVAEAKHEAAVAMLEKLGARVAEFDMNPFYETAQLLYEGPWLAERYIVAQNLLRSSPEAVHPVTRQITEPGAKPSAADAFRAFYKLEALRRNAQDVFETIDAMVLPTAPTAYTVEDVLSNPIELNSRMGTYTNFVNLLDLCGLAVPTSVRGDGVPYGVTLLARGGDDMLLASIGRSLHASTGLPLGSLGLSQPPLPKLSGHLATGEIAVAVVGAHLSGMPLNGELRDLSGRLLETTVTAADYKLYALKGTSPPKPGLVRVEAGRGASIAVEVWALSAESFGKFVAAIPQPMTIGTIALGDGRLVKGFLVEPAALDGARDISSFGGWRAFMTSAKSPA